MIYAKEINRDAGWPCPKDQPRNSRIKALSKIVTAQLLRRREGLEIEFNYVQNSGHQSWGELPDWQYRHCHTLMCWEGKLSSLYWKRTIETLCLEPSQTSPLHLSLWLDVICILCYIKTIIISIAFSWVFLVILANYITPDNIVGTSKFVAKWSEVRVA